LFVTGEQAVHTTANSWRCHSEAARGEAEESMHFLGPAEPSVPHRVKDRFAKLCLAGLLFLFSLNAYAAEIIDRIVATVNGHVILQSDWDGDMRYEAFLNGRALEPISAEDREAALHRLIDQELLHQQAQASNAWHPSEVEITKATLQIRQQLPNGRTDRAWQAALASYGLSEADLRRRVVAQLELMHFVDNRLRPAVRVDSKDVESYYNQEFLPQILRSGSKPVPLASVSARVQELLTQQQINERLVAWIQQLRAASNIHTNLRGRNE
jgi:peptidyl-prolyl cis-trans isomerase SurA